MLLQSRVTECLSQPCIDKALYCCGNFPSDCRPQLCREGGAVCIHSYLEDESRRQMATCGNILRGRSAACEFMLAQSLIKTMVPYLTTT